MGKAFKKNHDGDVQLFRNANMIKPSNKMKIAKISKTPQWKEDKYGAYTNEMPANIFTTSL